MNFFFLLFYNFTLTFWLNICSFLFFIFHYTRCLTYNSIITKGEFFFIQNSFKIYYHTFTSLHCWHCEKCTILCLYHDPDSSQGSLLSVWYERGSESNLSSVETVRYKRSQLQGNRKVNSACPLWWLLMPNLIERKYVLLHLTDGFDSESKA